MISRDRVRAAAALAALLAATGCGGQSPAGPGSAVPRASDNPQGQSPGTPGESPGTPSGESTAAAPARTAWPGTPGKDGLIFHGSRRTAMVSLTFDADMTPQMWHNLDTGVSKSAYERRIIETLRATRTPATLFVTGMWIERYPKDTQELAADPLFEFGNHSYKHYAFKEPCYGLPAIAPAEMAADVTRTTRLLDRYVPGHTPYFRFPGGCYNPTAIQQLAPANLTPVQWDVISGDAFLRDPKKIIDIVRTESKGGSIIIMHLNGAPNAPATYAALPEIIKNLRAGGLKPVKLSELLAAGSS